MKKHILILHFFIIFLSCNHKDNKNIVPFEYDGHYYIEAIIDDSIRGKFVFDTGASGLFLDSSFVAKHPSIIKSQLDTTQMRGAGATSHKDVLSIKNDIQISFGGYTQKFMDSPILKLTDINGEGIAGIIGNEFISNKILFIDNELNNLRIDSIINRTDFECEISFNYAGDRIYLPTKIQLNTDKVITANLMLDLGCSDAIILNTPYFDNLQKVNTSPQSIINYTILFGGAVGGNSNGGEFRSPFIALDNIRFENPIISFSKDTLGAFSKTNYDGLIGNDIFNRFNYAIDYSKHKIYLNKNKNFHKSFSTTKTGFYAQKTRNVAIVQSIYYESEAHQNGLELGDTITSINNKQVKNLTAEEFYKELREDGRVVNLTVNKRDKDKNISFKIKDLL